MPPTRAAIIRSKPLAAPVSVVATEPPPLEAGCVVAPPAPAVPPLPPVPLVGAPERPEGRSGPAPRIDNDSDRSAPSPLAQLGTVRG